MRQKRFSEPKLRLRSGKRPILNLSSVLVSSTFLDLECSTTFTVSMTFALQRLYLHDEAFKSSFLCQAESSTIMSDEDVIA